MKEIKKYYRGVVIEQNPLTGNWFLFFRKGSKYADCPPFAGTLGQMKTIINDAIKVGKGGEKQFIQEAQNG